MTRRSWSQPYEADDQTRSEYDAVARHDRLNVPANERRFGRLRLQ
jgi:hypothetical protein